MPGEEGKRGSCRGRERGFHNPRGAPGRACPSCSPQFRRRSGSRWEGNSALNPAPGAGSAPKAFVPSTELALCLSRPRFQASVPLHSPRAAPGQRCPGKRSAGSPRGHVRNFNYPGSLILPETTRLRSHKQIKTWKGPGKNRQRQGGVGKAGTPGREGLGNR